MKRQIRRTTSGWGPLAGTTVAKNCLYGYKRITRMVMLSGSDVPFMKQFSATNSGTVRSDSWADL